MKISDDINIGDMASFTKAINEAELYLSSRIPYDCNPLHVDELYTSTE
jgi:hypothetical protein